MSRRWGPLLFLLFCPGLGWGAVEKGAAPSLASAWKKHAVWFSSPEQTSLGHLRVLATEEFMLALPAQKKQALEDLADTWTHMARPGVVPLYIDVHWAYGGWLWEVVDAKSVGEKKLRLVDQWDDATAPWTAETSLRDRWFFFAGGQSVSGGDVGSSSGFNLRLGTTLFKNRYDLAFLFNKTSTGPSPKVKATALGFIGRMLFRGPGHWGYNVGGQLTSLSASGASADRQLSAVGGLNYYQGHGAWDMSLTLGDEGSRTLVLGYSIFFDR